MTSPDPPPRSDTRSSPPATLPLDNDPARSLAELERALREVPAYADWRALDPGRTTTIDERYAALPVTTKELMLAHAPRGFVPRSADLDAALATKDAELVRTSGTPGPPITLVWSQSWWDASEQASYPLHADIAAVATGRDREAVFASPRCVGPGERERPLSITERTLGRFLFPNEHADIARWTDDTIRRMARELVDYAPTLIEGEPAYLAAFCARAVALHVELPQPRVVTLSYTYPSRLERARIAHTFGAPVASVYGSTETGTVLVECERGRMHHNADSCRVEVADRRLLVTPFAHPFACYLRFDIGDLVRLATTPCPCGRRGGAIERVEGRVVETTTGRDDRIITVAELDDVLATAPTSEHVISYQLEQRDGVHLRVTATDALDLDGIASSLRTLYPDPITVERVPALEPERSGKYARVRR